MADKSDRTSHQKNQSQLQDKRQQNNNATNNQPDNQLLGNHSQWMMNLLTWVLVVSSMLYFASNIKSATHLTLAYSAFKKELRVDNVESVIIRGQQLDGQFRFAISDTENASASYKSFKTILPSFDDDELLTLLDANNVEFEIASGSAPLWITIVLNTAPWLILIGFFMYSSAALRRNLTGREGGFGFSKSKAKYYDASNIKVRYSDVAGLDNAKRDLQEVINYLKEPEHFRRIGAKMPKGILMMGPPGCGKTLLAKATAGEAGVPFFSVSGSEFIEMYVGVGAARVRDMFASASKQAPALIFIDEIDSVGRVRGTGLGGGNDEREQTLNQILAEMDGFSSDQAIVVLAATNRPDVLDPALLRPGRFDRKLVLELPGRKARADIIAVHTRNMPLDKAVDIDVIAAETVGFSGADLENLANEAALRATRHNNNVVSQQDFEMARDKVIMGSPLNESLTQAERKMVAVHESGHTLVTWYAKKSDPINKVSIIPRGRSLGVTEQLPTEDRHNYSQDYLEEKLSILLAGRVAEQLEFGQLSSGAADDLKQATILARRMVTQWGMSEQLGAVNFQQGEEHPFLGREITEPKQFSEHSAQLIDDEIRALLSRCENNSRKVLQIHHNELKRLAKALNERETLNSTDIQKILSKTD
jgi:cell division protease FtsH